MGTGVLAEAGLTIQRRVLEEQGHDILPVTIQYQ